MSHLKRLVTPKTWTIDRKQNIFITRPKPGAHPLDISLPLGVILRDFIKYTHTIKEAKKMLNNQEVLIDGKRKKDYRLPVGLFDVISFPKTKENFRVLLDTKGRLIIKKIDSKESTIKLCKITNKTVLSKKLQLNLHDGKNILVAKDFKGKVGDTIILNLPDLKIKETLELKPGAFIFLTKGKWAGDSGLLKEIQKNRAIYQKDSQHVETLKKYLFVLGDKKSTIALN